jgi:DNA-binding MarR family transcriptional regulator
MATTQIRGKLKSKLTAKQGATALMETMPLVMRHIRRLIRTQKPGQKSNVSLAQVRLFALLKDSPGASLSDVAEFLGVSKPTASALVERMVQRGLVLRADDPNERRCVVLSLTASGEAYLQEIRQFAIGEIGKLFEAIPEEEMFKLIEGLSLLKSAFAPSATVDLKG